MCLLLCIALLRASLQGMSSALPAHTRRTMIVTTARRSCGSQHARATVSCTAGEPACTGKAGRPATSCQRHTVLALEVDVSSNHSGSNINGKVLCGPPCKLVFDDGVAPGCAREQLIQCLTLLSSVALSLLLVLHALLESPALRGRFFYDNLDKKHECIPDCSAQQSRAKQLASSLRLISQTSDKASLWSSHVGMGWTKARQGQLVVKSCWHGMDES
eukprot:361313-Chlamydomonas_euryale.AAC.9